MVAYGVDHGVELVMNVVKGDGKPPTPHPLTQISPKEPLEWDA